MQRCAVDAVTPPKSSNKWKSVDVDSLMVVVVKSFVIIVRNMKIDIIVNKTGQTFYFIEKIYAENINIYGNGKKEKKHERENVHFDIFHGKNNFLKNINVAALCSDVLVIGVRRYFLLWLWNYSGEFLACVLAQ